MEPTLADEVERDHTLVPTHSLGPTHLFSEHKKGGGYQELTEHQDLYASELGPGNADPHSFDRLDKYDNLLVQSQENSTPLEDGSASPVLRRLRNSLKRGFRRQASKKSSPAHYRTTLAIPELPSQDRPGREGRSKVRSRTAAEERYIKPRERGRGSFVVVKIKEPGPEEFLGGRYVRKIEENFRINHLFGSLTVDVEEGMANIIRQGQVREGGWREGREGGCEESIGY